MSHETDRSDESLARDAKSGSAPAFDRLVRRHLRPAMALAWQYTRRVQDAEDVVQEAFHRAVRSLQDYDDARPFGSWFYTIVRNVARSAVTKDARRRELVPTVWLEDDPPAPAMDPSLAMDIERAVDSLAPGQQTCFRLCEVEGFTSVEAAGMLGISEASVRTHLARARRHLQAIMGSTEDATLPRRQHSR